MLGLLHAIIPSLCLHACCTLTLFLYFWHFNPYILQHFSENVFTLYITVITPPNDGDTADNIGILQSSILGGGGGGGGVV